MSIVPPLHEETIGLSDTVAEQVVITPVASNEEDLGDVNDDDIKMGDTTLACVNELAVTADPSHMGHSAAAETTPEAVSEPLPWEDLEDVSDDNGVEPEHNGDPDEDLDDIGETDMIGEDDVLEVDADDGAGFAEAALPDSEV